MKKTFAFLCVLCVKILFFSSLLLALDFGLVLDNNLSYSNEDFEYSGTLIPRFSALFNENELYISAGLNFNTDKKQFIPELLRTEAIFRFGLNEIKIGRSYYQDPLGFIASGLFDGALYSYASKQGTIYACVWYTGFLYKERTVIEMTVSEMQVNATEFNYDDFTNTYFAPRRLLASVGWKNPTLANLFSIDVSLLGQFELSDADEKLHSQYLAAKISMPIKDFIFNAGGAFELIEYKDEINIGLAGKIGVSWFLPTKINDKLSLNGIFTSGVLKNSSVTAFLPLTKIQQGNILKTNISGVSILSLDYLARLHKTLSANITTSYFIRSDLGTFNNYALSATESKGYLLGAEIYGQLFWGINSNIWLNLGGGVFLPSLGDVTPKLDNLWRAELKLILSLI